VNWTAVFTKQARKDAKKLSASGLRSKADGDAYIVNYDDYH
jgi:hypothetical protein